MKLLTYDEYYTFIVDSIRSLCETMNNKEVNKLLQRLNNKYTAIGLDQQISEVYNKFT
jgi:hypothetical protein